MISKYQNVAMDGQVESLLFIDSGKKYNQNELWELQDTPLLACG